ncbi:hypothetical protein CR159_11655 [Pollutimonas subterranea]|uniref:J domain-containing protein n=1 Tax=Pollutimonas subterranea TaxID=2045210 RepID=A0A2N4U3J1_9BURK|nr:hypothetical protein [Pollutimonas subterranea]PLC49585.1 hypothetical protein CR159_11655 [Pollutimonas subterranea]
MEVSTTKFAHQAPSDAQGNSEKKFNDAWQRVINQQKRNDGLRADAQAFAQDIQSRIQDKEKAYMDAMYFACLHLLSFCTRKSLAQWHREMLLEWAAEYVQAMENNPFSQHLDMSALQRRMADAFAVAYPEPQLEAGAGDFDFDDNGHDIGGDEDPSIQDMFQDLFDEFERADAAGNPFAEHDDPHSEHSFFNEFSQRQQAHEQQVRDENLALKQLIRSSSVNKLFRKLAGILHPDKERDETVRMEKNRLMSELIRARDSNDIPRLFAFYAEYVGESPLQELGGDLDGAAQLLDRHLLYLREQKDDILDENPLAGALYRRFHKSTPAASQRAVNKHLKEIHALTNALRDMRHDITSVNRLKPYLELRRDMFFQEDVFDYI